MRQARDLGGPKDVQHAGTSSEQRANTSTRTRVGRVTSPISVPTRPVTITHVDGTTRVRELPGPISASEDSSRVVGSTNPTWHPPPQSAPSPDVVVVWGPGHRYWRCYKCCVSTSVGRPASFGNTRSQSKEARALGVGVSGFGAHGLWGWGVVGAEREKEVGTG